LTTIDNLILRKWGIFYGLSIQMKFMAIARPQTNGQAKSTNKEISNGLKKKLDAVKALWVDELLVML